jgi:hypothetical protein
MGLGQTLLTILALAMLGTLMLTVNRNTLDNGQAIEESEYRIMASSLGISTLERAQGMAFDDRTKDSDISSESHLTQNLGPEHGETTEATFDDFDDFDGFSKWVLGNAISFRSADYLVRDSVDYVTISSSQIVHSAGRTYHKRIRVWVSSPFMQDTLMFQSIYSYWYFR